MTKYKLIIVFILFVQILSGQEQERSTMLQNPLRINDSELKRILDSISITKIHPDFFGNSIYSKIDTSTTNSDTIYSKSAEYKRMQMLFGSYSDFQRKFLALDLKNEIPDLKIPKFPKINSRLDNPDFAGQVGFSLGGPVTAIYNAFSKQEQSLRKYYALREYEPNQKRINAKYNYAKVKQWTGLKDDELTKFVLYCHFEDTFLLNASDYDLINMVLIKLTEFQAIEDSCNYQQ